MTMQWSDERLDAALREFLDVRADEIGVAARPVRAVSTDLADQLGVSRKGRRSGRRTWRNSFMSNTLKVALTGATALFVGLVLGLYLSQPGGLIGPPVATPSPDPTLTAAPPLVPIPEPTPEAATPVEIAQAYIAARNMYDPGRARDLLADDFTTDEPPDGFRALSSLELAFENHEAWGFHHSVGDCRESEPTASPEIAIVECESQWTTEVHRRGEFGPTPVTFVFSIRDGRITRVVHSASDYDWYFGPRSFYEGFLSEHLEFRALVDRNHNLEPEATQVVIDLLPEYFQLYEEWLSGDSTGTPTSSEVGVFQPGMHAMSTPREEHTATLLSDGRVLLVGGANGLSTSFFESAETYNPATGEFMPAGSMSQERSGHTATLLADGHVLVTGGGGGAGSSSAEIYDPGSGVFSPASSMGDSRRRHTATLLADGRVLVAGGPWATADLFDAASGTFSPTGSMSEARQHHTATLLRDGRVLIVGGWGYASAEIYDPVSGTFNATGSMQAMRGGHGAVLLADGRVLVVGGCSIVVACGDFPDALDTAELYDPATGAFSPTGPLAHGRHLPSATLLANGRVLVAGGRPGALWGNTAEIYDPATGTFALAAPMGAVRMRHTATLLPDGRVLLAGGQSTSQETLDSVEFYTP